VSVQPLAAAAFDRALAEFEAAYDADPLIGEAISHYATVGDERNVSCTFGSPPR